MNPSKIISLSIVVALVVVNVVLIWALNEENSRWGRILCSGIYCLYFLVTDSSKKVFLLGAFLLFLIADIFILDFESTIAQQAFFALHSSAYLLLLFEIKENLEKFHMSSFQKLYFSIVFAVNGIFVFVIGNTLTAGINDIALTLLFYLHGFSSLLLIAGAILVYDRYSNEISASFLVGVLALALSNLTGFASIYLDHTTFLYLSRIFYILALFCLVYFSEISNGAQSRDLNELEAKEENTKGTSYHEY